MKHLSKFRLLLLLIGLAASFIAGYAKPADAWPIYGRNQYYGYFKNIRDSWGDSVWHTNGPTEYAVPLWINTADEFINFTEAKLAQGPGTQDGVGAAFIIQTMIGSARDLPPNGAQIADWEARVRYAYSQGWINWNQTVSYRLNSYYQGPCSGYNCDQKPGDANPRDDAFYDPGTTESATAIVFRHSDGSIAYMIRHLCANPIGSLSPLTPAPPPFAFDGESFIDGQDRNQPSSPYITGQKNLLVFPGDTVNLFHFVWNWGSGGGWTRYEAWQHPRVGGVWNPAPGMAGPPWWPNPGYVYLNPGQSSLVNWNRFTVPSSAQPGDTFCQHVGFFWTAWDKPWPTDKVDEQACAQVTNHYNLTPSVTASATAAQQNDTITFTYRVSNAGPTVSKSTACKAAGGTHGPGYTPLPAQDADRNPDTGFNLGCPRIFPLGTTTLPTETVDVGNLPPGSRICRSLVIDPKDQWGGPRSSAEACVVIAKTPYVHFQGNDVWAGGGFADVNPACNTSSKITTSAHALKDGTVAGSGVEYAAFALGKITNFGSAGKAIVNPAAPAGKMLTFSNVNNNNLGFYGAPQHCINNYISTYSGTPITIAPGTIDLNQGSGTHQINGPHTFHGTVPNGSQQVWLVNGDVTIDGDIKYSDSYGSVGEIPSIVIISTGNIFVKAGVKQMDGLFVAKSAFNTCSDAPPGNLSTNDCKDQLIINGSVVAGTLTLLRTYGADGNNDTVRKNPAEIFNFNAEMYLKSALNGTNSTTLRTVDEKDLPPRY